MENNDIAERIATRTRLNVSILSKLERSYMYAIYGLLDKTLGLDIIVIMGNIDATPKTSIIDFMSDPTSINLKMRRSLGRIKANIFSNFFINKIILFYHNRLNIRWHHGVNIIFFVAWASSPVLCHDSFIKKGYD